MSTSGMGDPETARRPEAAERGEDPRPLPPIVRQNSGVRRMRPQQIWRRLSSAWRLLRRAQIRLVIMATHKTLSLSAAAVLETGLFDARVYGEAAGLTGASAAEAASHYATIGERRGLRPNASFDPLVYASIYPELLNSGMGLLVHYARFGAREGRLGFIDIDRYVRQGRQAFDPTRKTVMIVTHEASRTGAPILAWNLVTAYSRTHNVIALLLEGGELREDFDDHAVLAVGPLVGEARISTAIAVVVAELSRRHPIDFAIVNSIVSHPAAPGLAASFVPTVMLVHEFASDPNIPGGMVTFGARMATQVVVDAQSQLDDALAAWPGITPRPFSVFHQGASEIPRERPRPPTPNGSAVATPVPRRDIGRLVRGPRDVPVVLGLGSVSMRKGVDLFVSIAQGVTAELGCDRVRFVWIGGTPKAHPEGVYPGWLADQIRRAGLSKVVEILEPVDDLAEAFAAASVAISPSRLDPFPNVAMDAALAGVPLICFERANGFADFLIADARTRSLAVPYLDVAAASRRVVDLLRDDAGRRDLGDILRTRAHRDFPMSRYVERLGPVIEIARRISAQERIDTEVLEADDTFSPFLWATPHEPVPFGRVARFYVRKAASGQEANQYCRRPALGFVPQTYAEHHPELDRVPFENPLAHWIRAGKPSGLWSHGVMTASAGRPVTATSLRVALHIHLHYPELADGMLRALSANASGLDLLVSTTSDDKAADLRRRLARYDKGSVTVEPVPNRGRDIGPLLSLFAERLRAYDVIGHVHGKRSLALTSVGLGTDIGVVWYDFLMQHLIGAKFPVADMILGRFAAEPKLGLVFPEDPNLTGWSLDRDIAVDLAARMDPAMMVPRFIDFPIGTMFWARPAALKPLFDLKLDWADYPEEPVPIDGTMLHALERLLPVICHHAGFAHETTHVPGVGR